MRENLLSYLYDIAANGYDVSVSYRRRLRWARWSYAKLAQTAFQFARELEERGVGKGDHMMIWAENCPEWIAAFYGAMIRGVVVVPIDEQSTRDFVERVVGRTRPKLLLHGKKAECSELGLDAVKLEDLPALVLRHSDDIYRADEISRSDVVEVVFTSGTTGEPRGVTLTHENLLANIEVIEKVIRRYRRWKFIVHPLRVLCLLPLSHVFGQVMGFFVPPMLQMEVVMQDRLDPAEIIDTIKLRRVSVLATVPRILETLRERIERDAGEGFARDVAEAGRWGAFKKWWRFRRVHSRFGLKFWSFVSGGATLAGETEGFWQRLGFVVVQGYGMTETSALVSLNNPFKLRRGSLGEVLAGQEVKIDESGEILVRGRNVSQASGYGAGGRGLSEGWLRTGDIGYLDESGRLYFKGRKKDVIVTTAGLNVYPEDIEAELDRQPEVARSTVFGLEGKNGEEPVAALILRPGASAEEAVTLANRSLAPHQQICRWVIWPEPDFPRTPTMKVRKNVVADLVRQQLSGAAEKAGGSSSVLADILVRVGAGNAGSATAVTRLGEGLGLDSLGRVELMSAIEERLHIDLDERAFAAAETVGDLERLIRAEPADEAPPFRFIFPRWSLRTLVRWLRMAFYNLITLPVTLVLCRVNVKGLDNLEKLDSPVLFASNHVTEIDAGLIMLALPGRFRNRLAIAMDGEKLMQYRYPPVGTSLLERLRTFFAYWLAIALFNVFPMPRRSGFRKSFEYAGVAMDAGYSVLIFPEGQITKDGGTQKLKQGVGLLANGLETATVPVRISGLYEQRIAGRRFYAPPGSVTISFGESIPFVPHRDPAELVSALQRDLT